MPSRNHRIELIKSNTIPLNERAGKVLADLRKAKKLTLRELSLKTMDDTGSVIAHQSLQSYEKGSFSISLDKLDRICRALGVTIFEFTQKL